MQSFLDLYRRPVVHFDPKNSQHREQAAIFLRTGTWAKSPYAFYAPDNLSIKAYALQSMVEYYIENEFPLESTKSTRSKKSVNKSHHGKLISIQRGV